MPRPLLDHLSNVTSRLAHVGEMQSACFAAACVERSWRAYVRAAQGKPWNRGDTLRRTLDTAWSWCSGSGPRPAGLSAAAEGAVDVFDETGMQQPSDNAGRHVAVATYNLIASIEERNSEGFSGSAQLNLDFIDAFLYEYLDLEQSTENDEAVDRHELMNAERNRQTSDLVIVSERWSVPGTVEELRQTSTDANVLGEYWYR